MQKLQLLLDDTAAQQLSTVLWSSATLGLDPDAVVPGMVHGVTNRFLHLINARDENQRFNSQNCANVLWALAAMDHPKAISHVVDTVCLHFAHLKQHVGAKQRPSAQNCANLLSAVAKIGHSAATEAMDSVCLHFMSLDQHSDAEQRPKAQEWANLLWALAIWAIQQQQQGCWVRSACILHILLEAQLSSSGQLLSLVWALDTLKHPSPDDSLLDHLCIHAHPDPQSR